MQRAANNRPFILPNKQKSLLLHSVFKLSLPIQIFFRAYLLVLQPADSLQHFRIFLVCVKTVYVLIQQGYVLLPPPFLRFFKERGKGDAEPALARAAVRAHEVLRDILPRRPRPVLSLLLV